jgi:hypothetical protein
LIRQYDLGVTENHLEVGVGTGFLLDRCSFPSTSPRLGLIDVSKRSLEESSRRLARYAPHIYVHNILEPLPSGIEPYRSIGTNYVFHCVPGGFAEKGRAFGYLKRVLAKDGVLFGSTLLGSEVERNGIAKTLMGIYNRGGLFSNLADSPSSLYAALKQDFAKVELEIVGCCALFSARDGV